MGASANFWLGSAADGAEALLEFVDASFGIDELFLASEERMRIRGDAGGNHGVLYTIDGFLFLGSFRGARDEASASSHVNEDDWIVLGM